MKTISSGHHSSFKPPKATEQILLAKKLGFISESFAVENYFPHRNLTT
jgi:hypothetical protein